MMFWRWFHHFGDAKSLLCIKHTALEMIIGCCFVFLEWGGGFQLADKVFVSSGVFPPAEVEAPRGVRSYTYKNTV